MSAFAGWLSGALIGSSTLMLFVLALRVPVGGWIGPRLGYALWALPAVRMILPPVPAGLYAAIPGAVNASAKLSVLVVGPHGSGLWQDPITTPAQVGTLLLVIWLGGASVLLGLHIARHIRFRRRLLASAVNLGRRGTIDIIEAATDGPLAFGVFRRYVAVPLGFTDRYNARERDLALAHECAHHERGDLIANWVSLVILAMHWWNPIAWVAIRAFREDQEFAVDAHVLTVCDPAARPHYAQLLAKAAGLGALPVCNLNARSNLKGRLMMLAKHPLPKSRRILGAGALTLVAATALAATVSVNSAAAPPTKRQALTIGVKPTGTGDYALIVGGAMFAPGARMPASATLPLDLTEAGGCDLKPSAKPVAMAIKGSGGITTYTVMCASTKPASIRATLEEGLVSLKTMRGSVATQQATPQFPEAERTHALGAIDRSIREVKATLAQTQ